MHTITGLTAILHAQFESSGADAAVLELRQVGDRDDVPLGAAVADHPRNKTDDELRALAAKGGVAGIYFMPYLRPGVQPTAQDVVRHVEHAVNVAGEDHVGIGTDGTVSPTDRTEAFEKAKAMEKKAA